MDGIQTSQFCWTTNPIPDDIETTLLMTKEDSDLSDTQNEQEDVSDDDELL